MARPQGTSNVMENPAGGKERFIQWKNPNESKGIKNSGFYFYEKSEIEGEKGRNVMMEFPLTFQYLEDVSGVGGYLTKREKNIFSNEVLDIYETPLDIKTWDRDNKEEILESGFYYSDQKVPRSEMTEKEFKEFKLKKDDKYKKGTLQDITNKVTGSKRIKVLYILINDKVWRMKLEGAKSKAWKDFQDTQNKDAWKGKNLDKNLVNFIVWDGVKTVENKLGADYDVPTFVYEKATVDENKTAQNVYEDQIKPYFEFILGKPKEEEVTDYN